MILKKFEVLAEETKISCSGKRKIIQLKLYNIYDQDWGLVTSHLHTKILSNDCS
jgi:hypothetical protein